MKWSRRYGSNEKRNERMAVLRLLTWVWYWTTATRSAEEPGQKYWSRCTPASAERAAILFFPSSPFFECIWHSIHTAPCCLLIHCFSSPNNRRTLNFLPFYLHASLTGLHCLPVAPELVLAKEKQNCAFHSCGNSYGNLLHRLNLLANIHSSKSIITFYFEPYESDSYVPES